MCVLNLFVFEFEEVFEKDLVLVVELVEELWVVDFVELIEGLLFVVVVCMVVVLFEIVVVVVVDEFDGL